MKTYTKWRMCTRKKGFETQSRANKSVLKQRNPEQWKVYECPICFCWHIAHNESKEKGNPMTEEHMTDERFMEKVREKLDKLKAAQEENNSFGWWAEVREAEQELWQESERMAKALLAVACCIDQPDLPADSTDDYSAGYEEAMSQVKQAIVQALEEAANG